MSTHNIYFHGDIRKYYVDTSSCVELCLMPVLLFVCVEVLRPVNPISLPNHTFTGQV